MHIILRLRRFRGEITVKTYKLHLQLSIALLIQVSYLLLVQHKQFSLFDYRGLPAVYSEK